MIAIQKTDVYESWFRRIADRTVKARINSRIKRLSLGNFGDAQSVGGGVSELRLHFGSGWRVYFAKRGIEYVLLLAGGDKSTQAKDIQLAKTLANDLKGVIQNDNQD